MFFPCPLHLMNGDRTMSLITLLHQPRSVQYFSTHSCDPVIEMGSGTESGMLSKNVCRELIEKSAL